jgi:hypothetical protein
MKLCNSFLLICYVNGYDDGYDVTCYGYVYGYHVPYVYK